MSQRKGPGIGGPGLWAGRPVATCLSLPCGGARTGDCHVLSAPQESHCLEVKCKTNVLFGHQKRRRRNVSPEHSWSWSLVWPQLQTDCVQVGLCLSTEQRGPCCREQEPEQANKGTLLHQAETSNPWSEICLNEGYFAVLGQQIRMTEAEELWEEPVAPVVPQEQEQDESPGWHARRGGVVVAGRGSLQGPSLETARSTSTLQSVRHLGTVIKDSGFGEVFIHHTGERTHFCHGVQALPLPPKALELSLSSSL